MLESLSLVCTKGNQLEIQGNLLLQNILDSDIETLELIGMHEVFGGVVSERMDGVADDLRARGYKPFVARFTLPDISAILSTVGWASGTDEIITQLKDQNIDAQYVVLASAGGMTQAGLVLGSKYLRANFEVIGISVEDNKDTVAAAGVRYIDAASDFLGLGVRVAPDEFEVHDD